MQPNGAIEGKAIVILHGMPGIRWAEAALARLEQAIMEAEATLERLAETEAIPTLNPFAMGM